MTNDMEPTMIKGRKKPPILYNQAPVAGPKAKEKIIHLRTYVHLGNSFLLIIKSSIIFGFTNNLPAAYPKI